MRESVRLVDYLTDHPNSEGDGDCTRVRVRSEESDSLDRLGVLCSVVCMDACGVIGQRAGMDKATWAPILRFH